MLVLWYLFGTDAFIILAGFKSTFKSDLRDECDENEGIWSKTSKICMNLPYFTPVSEIQVNSKKSSVTAQIVACWILPK